ncbi:MAG: M14 family zinc carboxypeptidase, partial [Acidimicrobiia bacterium]
MSAGALKKVVAKPNQAKPSKAWGVLASLLILAPTVALAESELGARKTALEQSHYQRTSSSVEISRFLKELDEASALARKETLGSSAGGRPLDALLISEDTDLLKDDRPSPMRLTMMLIGSQHGTETSGGEALLIIARELLGGSLRTHVADTD